MRTIVCGSRSVTDYELLVDIMKGIPWQITTILSGNARGVDKLGERYAKEYSIPLEIYPANWKLYGKRAGLERNLEMIAKSEALIALWDGISVGTKHCIIEAKKVNLRMLVYRFE